MTATARVTKVLWEMGDGGAVTHVAWHALLGWSWWPGVSGLRIHVHPAGHVHDPRDQLLERGLDVDVGPVGFDFLAVHPVPDSAGR